MNSYIFGAGASHSYDRSPTHVRPPLASGFFEAYCDLDIAGDIEVRVGDIVSYVRGEYGVPDADFCSFNLDAETFMTRLDSHVQDYVAGLPPENLRSEEYGELVNRVRAHDQMLLLFAHVLNEIQNGPVADVYGKLVVSAHPTDCMATFNWDTLLDRALATNTDWLPDVGYSVPFRAVLEGDWRDPIDSPENGKGDRRLLKLHGSTNWLVNYMTWDLRNGKRIMIDASEPPEAYTRMSMDPRILEAVVSGEYTGPAITEGGWGHAPPPGPDEEEGWPALFVHGLKAYPAYKSRYRPGYEPYSYFFPPNDPQTGVPLIPFIVPPTEYKLYDEYAHVLDPLWGQAREGLLQSDMVYLIGYSLPPTDHRAIGLFRDVLSRVRQRWLVVNPSPDPVIDRLVHLAGAEPDLVEAHATTFANFMGR